MSQFSRKLAAFTGTAVLVFSTVAIAAVASREPVPEPDSSAPVAVGAPSTTATEPTESSSGAQLTTGPTGPPTEEGLVAYYEEQIAACAKVWGDTRASVRSEGKPDGEARRAADEARYACEEPYSEALRQLLEGAQPPSLVCRNDKTGRLTQTTLAAGGPPAIYLVCRGDEMADLPNHPATGSPVADAIKGDTALQLGQVIAIYAEGPSPDEANLGYGAFFDRQLPVKSVTLNGDRAVIDFTEDIVRWEGLGYSGFLNMFLSELRANVFQFDDIAELELRIEGDCQEFWELTAYGTCQILDRKAQ
jgi:hypothetical protein